MKLNSQSVQYWWMKLKENQWKKELKKLHESTDQTHDLDRETMRTS
jgi:hypothetical protein